MRGAKRILILFFLIIGCLWHVEAQRRPIIGISDLYKNDNNAAVPRSYVDAVLQTGGIPVVVPLIHEKEKIIELLNSLDGLVFTGGEDFDPSYYNERAIPQMGKINAPRDEFDIKLLRLAVERGVPVLGICRGLQLINITFGGSLYQDLTAQYHDRSIQHRQRQPKDEASHSVLIEENTVFADIVKDRLLMVNSSHHQAIKDLAPGFRIGGRSSDRIIEAIEKIDDENWILGVQFHPEVRVMKDNAMRRIFQRFINEAAGMENSNRKEKLAYVETPQLRRDSSRSFGWESSRQTASASSGSYDRDAYAQTTSAFTASERKESESLRPIVYQSVIDTQIIYKFVKDTIYLPAEVRYLPTDTVYLAVRDTQWIYVTDTIYFPATEITSSVSETLASTTSDANVSPANLRAATAGSSQPEASKVSGKDLEKASEKAPEKASGQISSLPVVTHSKADTLIYTPGAPVVIADSLPDKATRKLKQRAEKDAAKQIKLEEEERKKQDKRAKKELKEQTKQALKEAEAEKERYKKEQMEKAKQRRIQQKEKEKAEKEAQKKKTASPVE